MQRFRTTAALMLALVTMTVPAVTLLADEYEAEPIVVQDLHYGEILFYFYQDDYFPAIVRLLAAEQQSQLQNHAEDAELLLGGMFLSYGHHLKAAEIFERLLADNVAPEVRDRTWFFLAKIWYQRGYLDKSRDALGRISADVPEVIQREAQMLRAQILIDKGDYDAAIALLSNWKGRTEWSRYAQFNLGVALVRSGQVDAGANVLNELGDLDPFNEELTSLRDKANLALGYALLQAGRPGAAKVPLQRVRLEGPFSNKALLGVGWADAEMGNFKRALVPWMELHNRDLLDPAVQESMLAIPYAMAKLDSIGQAADHYLNAIEAYSEEISRIDRTIGQLESGRFFENFVDGKPLDSTGWYWRLEELPEGPEARYLFRMLSTHEFQEGLKNYRDLTYLHRNLDIWQQNVDVYENMLETRKQAYEQRLPLVEDALARADIESMVDEKLDFDSLLNDIEKANDWLGLADKREWQLWGEITGVENAPALRSDIPEAVDVNDKVDLLKGVLQWELEGEFKDRLWRIRRHLRETGEALIVTQRARRQIDEKMREEEQWFAEIGTRVYDLAPQIETMKMRVGDVIAEQRAFLQSIAVEELQAQKQRLDIYNVQARFALAAIYDIAATTPEEGE